MIINLIYEQDDNALPSAFKTVVNSVASFFEANFSDPITINITVGYGQVNGQPLSSGALGQSEHFIVSSNYAQVRNALIADAKTAQDALAVSTLPASDPTGGSPWRIPRADAKALGLLNPNSTQIDGRMGFSSTAPLDYDRSNGISAGTYDFYGIVAHEITEAMGRVFGNGVFYPYELFHFASPGVLQLDGDQFGYFSIDNGNTNLATFNTAASGDFADWASSVQGDAFRAFAQSGRLLAVSEADLIAMDALGYDRVGASPPPPLPPPPSSPAIPADFNGDARSDFLWQNTNGQIAVWLLNGLTVTAADAVGGNPGSAWHLIASGDFDSSGKADLLLQNTNGQVAIWLMNGLAITAADAVGGNPGAAWHARATGDFNGDGKSDILFQNDNGQVAVWFMNGLAIQLADAVAGNPGAVWHVRGAGDFNGDNKSDIVLQNDNGQVAVWLMNGLSVLSGDAVGGNPGTAWHVKGTGDFDGNSRSDILFQNDNGQVAIWFMNGLTVVAADAVAGNPGPAWSVVGAGDSDGDGRADIRLQNSGGQAALWLMNGFSITAGDAVGGNSGAAWHLVSPTGG